MGLTNSEIKVRIINNETANLVLRILETNQTLLTGLLGFSATLIAVYFTNKHNKKIENKKIQREKLEELHELVYSLGNTFVQKKEILKYANKDLKDYYRKCELSKSRIIILVNTYFHKELNSKSELLIKELDAIIDSLKLEMYSEEAFELNKEINHQASVVSIIQSKIENLDNNDPKQYDYFLDLQSQEKELNWLVTKQNSLQEEENKIKKMLCDKGNPDTIGIIDNFSKLKQEFLIKIIEESNKTFR